MERNGSGVEAGKDPGGLTPPVGSCVPMTRLALKIARRRAGGTSAPAQGTGC